MSRLEKVEGRTGGSLPEEAPVGERSTRRGASDGVPKGYSPRRREQSDIVVQEEANMKPDLPLASEPI